jgi:hypothetical protein
MPDPLLASLDLEWERLARSRAARQALAEWAADAPVLAGCDDLIAVERLLRVADAATADTILAAVARRAPGDDLAARALLQFLQPGCRRLIGQLGREFPRSDDRSAAVLGAAYERIRTYPIDRRPRFIALNVLLDTAKATRRRLRADEGREGPDAAMSHVESVPAAVELLELLRGAVDDGWVEHGDAALIARSRVGGEAIAVLAAERGCHPGALRRRRHRAEAALATAARAA